MTCALRLTGALYLAFTSGKHLFMLEPVSVTTGRSEVDLSLSVTDWAAGGGLVGKRVPTRPLAAEGRLTLNT